MALPQQMVINMIMAQMQKDPQFLAKFLGNLPQAQKSQMAQWLAYSMGAGPQPSNTPRTRGKAARILSDVGAGALGLGGGLVSAAGKGAGALAAGAGSAMSHIGTLGTSEAQRARYGDTPSAVAGRAASDLGAAAGVGIEAVTGTLGENIQEWAKAMKLKNLQEDLMASTQERSNLIKQMGLTPSEARLLEQMIRTQGHLSI